MIELITRFLNGCVKKSNSSCKNWNFRIKKQLELLNLDAENCNTIKLIEERMLENFKDNWKNKVTSDQGTRSFQSIKLKTYRKFKLDYGTEYYAKSILSRNNRSVH